MNAYSQKETSLTVCEACNRVHKGLSLLRLTCASAGRLHDGELYPTASLHARANAALALCTSDCCPLPSYSDARSGMRLRWDQGPSKGSPISIF